MTVDDGAVSTQRQQARSTQVRKISARTSKEVVLLHELSSQLYCKRLWDRFIIIALIIF